MNSIFPTESVAALAAGTALGVFYFYAMYHTIRLYAARAAASKIVLLYLLRGGAAVIVFWVIALQGALPLLLGLLGFLLARLVAQRWAGSLP
ncbi:MAG: ATP synthase subunit I [Terriglobales bacterium]